MAGLYAKDGKIYAGEYTEIYIPLSYFTDKTAINKGASVETLGIVYIKTFPGGKEGPLKLLNLPVIVNLMVYEFKEETIKVRGKPIDVMTLEYMKDAHVLHQSVEKGRVVAEAFLESILSGKLPNTLWYPKTIDLWWRNLDISGVSFKVPSKIFEMILASIYRNPNNMKQRYGQLYGRQAHPTGYDYKTGNVRSVVKDLSTFSGMVFEDISTMISNGVNNSIDGVEEPESPLEKIIHY